ncbi:hypothetical protein PPYR_05551 [Photinus pyralis]|uniref:Uncharacterized protein n=1 Tax=Photinus pyralis TaxID=7054 RepID=A0A5N4AV47_PHOPY|nr:hypothetical protein PPYR_05551 [Photinus pyralis]
MTLSFLGVPPPLLMIKPCVAYLPLIGAAYKISFFRASFIPFAKPKRSHYNVMVPFSHYSWFPSPTTAFQSPIIHNEIVFSLNITNNLIIAISPGYSILGGIVQNRAS